MPYQPTGIGGFGFSVNWEKVAGDEDVIYAGDSSCRVASSPPASRPGQRVAGLRNSRRVRPLAAGRHGRGGAGSAGFARPPGLAVLALRLQHLSLPGLPANWARETVRFPRSDCSQSRMNCLIGAGCVSNPT